MTLLQEGIRMPKLTAVLLVLASVAWARPQAPAVPPGTKLKVELQVKLDTKKAAVGDKVSAKLNEDLKLHGALIAAKNSQILGVVTQVDPSAGGQPAKLGILFNQLVPKQGTPLAIRAAVVRVFDSSSVRALEIPPELGGSGSAMTFNPGNPAYARMDRASNGIPVQFAIMETATGTGPDLGGVIQSVGENIVLDDGAHIQVQFLHN